MTLLDVIVVSVIALLVGTVLMVVLDVIRRPSKADRHFETQARHGLAFGVPGAPRPPMNPCGPHCNGSWHGRWGANEYIRMGKCPAREMYESDLRRWEREVLRPVMQARKGLFAVESPGVVAPVIM